MPFFRSAPSCGAGVLPHRHREQLNAITSFVDASMVYGSTTSLASALRNNSSPLGLMALNSQHSDRELAFMPFLPRQQAHLDPCGPRNATVLGALNQSMHWKNTTSCFQAGEKVNCRLSAVLSAPVVHNECFTGDSRANEHLGMIALHTLFLREHNRLVKELHLLNPHWSPDTLYQEARKIIGAIHQVQPAVTVHFTSTYRSILSISAPITFADPNLGALPASRSRWNHHVPPGASLQGLWSGSGSQHR